MKKFVAIMMISLLMLTSMPMTALGAEEATPSGIPFSQMGDEIDALVNEYLGVTTPGVAIVVIHNGEMIFSQNWGYADIENGILVDDSTVFEYASISKLFTWTAVMQLVEEGVLDLDALISNYLPEDFYNQLNHTHPFTMRDILNHTAGFEEAIFDMASIIRLGDDMPDVPTLEEFLLMQNPEQIFEPGTVSAYSNWGSALAGFVVQHISEQPFYQYQMHHIFERLGMDNTAGAPDWRDNPRVADTMARGYAPDGNDGFVETGWGIISGYPGGAARGTAQDLARFALALMPAEGETSPLFERNEILHQMLSPSYDTTGDMIGTYHGFLNYGDEDVISLGHGGDLPGFALDMAIVPEHGFGFVLLQNGGGEMSIRGELHGLLISPIVDTHNPDTNNLPDISNISGTLIGARMIDSNIVELGNYIGLMSVTPAGDNRLSLSSNGITMIYEQVAPYTFQVVKTDNPLFAQMMRRFTLEVEDGEITHMRIGNGVDAIALPANRTMPLLIGSVAITVANIFFFILAPIGLIIVALVDKKKKKGIANLQFNRHHAVTILCGTAFVLNNLSFVIMIATNPFQPFFWARNVMPWVNWLLLVSVAVFAGRGILALKNGEVSKKRQVAFWVSIALIGLFIPVLFSWNFFS